MAGSRPAVGVVGLGTMGAGIVEVFARAGLGWSRPRSTTRHSNAGRRTSPGRPTGRSRGASSPRTTATPCSAGSRFAVGLAGLRDVDLVIEAVPEHLDLKQADLRRADKVCKPSAILATNTSSLSVTEIAVATDRPRPGGRHALLQPGADHEAGRDRPHRGHRAEVVADVEALCAPARQGRRDDQRPGRVRRERAAVRLPQPRGVDGRERVRHPRRHRRGDAARAAACRWARSR